MNITNVTFSQDQCTQLHNMMNRGRYVTKDMTNLVHALFKYIDQLDNQTLNEPPSSKQLSDQKVHSIEQNCSAEDARELAKEVRKFVIENSGWSVVSNLMDLCSMIHNLFTERRFVANSTKMWETFSTNQLHELFKHLEQELLNQVTNVSGNAYPASSVERILQEAKNKAPQLDNVQTLLSSCTRLHLFNMERVNSKTRREFYDKLAASINDETKLCELMQTQLDEIDRIAMPKQQDVQFYHQVIPVIQEVFATDEAADLAEAMIAIIRTNPSHSESSKLQLAIGSLQSKIQEFREKQKAALYGIMRDHVWQYHDMDIKKHHFSMPTQEKGLWKHLSSPLTDADNLALLHVIFLLCNKKMSETKLWSDDGRRLWDPDSEELCGKRDDNHRSSGSEMLDDDEMLEYISQSYRSDLTLYQYERLYTELEKHSVITEQFSEQMKTFKHQLEIAKQRQCDAFWEWSQEVAGVRERMKLCKSRTVSL